MTTDQIYQNEEAQTIVDAVKEADANTFFDTPKPKAP
mgnify:CR=1 FL=1|jgi:hypothetical protein